MTTLTEQFDMVLNAIVDNEKRSARRIGEHLDRTKAALQNLKEEPQPQKALASSGLNREALQRLTCKQLDTLIRERKIKGISKAKRKAQKIELLLMPTFDQLYAFWLQKGSPALPVD